MDTYGSNNYLMTDEDAYEIALYDPSLEKKDYNDTTAYLNGDYYYLYRGEKSQYELDRMPGIRPGIYWNTTSNTPIMIEPIEEEKAKYTFADKIGELDAKKIVNDINEKKIVLVELPENRKSGQDMLILPDDDILKRLIKLAFNEKGVSIDQCTDGFPDKNAKFNFRAALLKDSPLSMNYFNRGCDALHLKYTIILEDADPSTPIGSEIEPIIASSEDTHEV